MPRVKVKVMRSNRVSKSKLECVCKSIKRDKKIYLKNLI